MTIAALKEVLQDRIDLLTKEFESMTDPPSSEQNRWRVGYVEGRLEEARVCLRLLERCSLRRPMIRASSNPYDWSWSRSSFGGSEAVECIDPNALTIVRN